MEFSSSKQGPADKITSEPRFCGGGALLATPHFLLSTHPELFTSTLPCVKK